MAKRSFYVKDSELDDYQVKVINKKTDNSYIVKGCAGSGKSILALWKAKQIQDEHKGTYLYIVFTKALMQYMADGISQVGIPQRNVDLIGFTRFDVDRCDHTVILCDPTAPQRSDHILHFIERFFACIDH